LFTCGVLDTDCPKNKCIQPHFLSAVAMSCPSNNAGNMFLQGRYAAFFSFISKIIEKYLQ